MMENAISFEHFIALVFSRNTSKVGRYKMDFVLRKKGRRTWRDIMQSLTNPGS